MSNLKGVKGGDGAEYKYTDELCAKDKKNLAKLISGFERIIGVAKAVKTYGDLLKVNERLDELGVDFE